MLTDPHELGKVDIETGDSVFLGNVFFLQLFGHCAVRDLLAQIAAAVHVIKRDWLVLYHDCDRDGHHSDHHQLFPAGVHFVCPASSDDDATTYDCGDHYDQ